MKKSDDLGEKIILGALLIVATRVALKGTEHAWSAVTRDSPPPKHRDSDVELREELAWVLLSGLAVGLTRVFARRGLPRLFGHKD